MNTVITIPDWKVCLLHFQFLGIHGAQPKYVPEIFCTDQIQNFSYKSKVLYFLPLQM